MAVKLPCVSNLADGEVKFRVLIWLAEFFADTAFCMGSTRSQHQEQQDLKEASAHTMDFRRAVLQGDKELIDRFVSDMVPRLTEYLVITFGANLDLARECVQQSFVLVLERIVSRTLTDDTNVASYLMVIARNEYFACLKREQRNGSAVFPGNVL